MNIWTEKQREEARYRVALKRGLLADVMGRRMFKNGHITLNSPTSELETVYKQHVSVFLPSKSRKPVTTGVKYL
jgi:hypothetical protein